MNNKELLVNNMEIDLTPNKPRKKQKNYINNPDLQYALEQYMNELNQAKKEGIKLPQIPKYIGEAFWKLCTKISNRPNFYSYSFKDEMVLDGIENCIQAIENYNFEHPLKNPFGYFSRIVWRAFLRRIDKEKKQAYIKHKNFQTSYIHEDMGHEGSHSYSTSGYVDDLISSYELKHLTKLKKPVKVKKVGVEQFVEGDE